MLAALTAEGGRVMVEERQIGLKVPVIGGNGMNSVKVFDLAEGASDNLWVGSPWSADNQSPENVQFIAAYTDKYKMAPDQFAAQAYDGVFIVAEALKNAQLTGKVEADRTALRDALANVQHSGATGPFTFRRVSDKAGKPAGFDANQQPIVSVTRDGRYTIAN